MNLLEETTELLVDNKLTVNDVLWVGDNKTRMTWADFARIANVEYDSGFGAQEVAHDLIVVGQNWWMERHEYDGSECWQFKQMPQKPEIEKNLARVVGGMWTSLEEMNRLDFEV